MQAKVLLLGENQQGYSRLIRCLDRYRCKCRFATTYQEAVPLLGIKDFDVVLSPMRVRDSSVFPLISLLENSRTTLFYFQPVEAGCWWLPALRFGRNCFGSYALRPSEFISSLNLVMEEIQKGPSPMTMSQVSAIQPSPIALPWPNTRSATARLVRAERPGLAKSTATG